MVGPLIGGGVVYYAYRQGINYTTDLTPPAAEFTAKEANAQYEALKPRITQLIDEQANIAETGDSQGKANPPPIRLTAADLNALAFKYLKDLPKNSYVSFAILEDRLNLHTSVPLKGVPLLNDRYFVGTIELREPPAGYPLPLYLHSITADRKPLPSTLISRFQDPEQARKLLQSNGLRDEISFVRSIRIKSVELVVELNSKQPVSN